MRRAKLLLCTTLFLAALGWSMLTITEPTSAANQKAGVGHHWRYNDGHWNYWHDGDQRWYYTDGSNWYYNNGTAWNVYGFDKQFGREGVERGEYKTPAEGAKITTPNHPVYKAPTK